MVFFFSLPQTKDAALNIAIAQSIVLTVLGHEIHEGDEIADEKVNPYCDDNMFNEFLSSIIRMVADPNPASRHSTGIWLLALIKNCSKWPSIYKRKDILQYAFTELLSDDSGKFWYRKAKNEQRTITLCIYIYISPNQFTDSVDNKDQ